MPAPPILNGGNNCYMIAGLHILFAALLCSPVMFLEALTKDLVGLMLGNCPPKPKLAHQLAKALRNMAAGNAQPLDMTEFFTAVKVHLPGFDNNRQQDASEFLLALFNCLPNLAELFMVNICITTTCPSCKAQTTTHSCVPYIALRARGHSTLAAAIVALQQPSESGWHCPKMCRVTCTAETTVTALPQLLLVTLGRNADGKDKCDTLLKYALQEDLPAHMGLPSSNYDLLAVGRHHGASVESGHYTTLTADNGSCFESDDARPPATHQREHMANQCTAEILLYSVRWQN
jgi:ubiquitin C-terminal hydrolase